LTDGIEYTIPYFCEFYWEHPFVLYKPQ